MDELLNGLYSVFSLLVPFMVCVFLFALVVLICKLITFLHDIKFTLSKVNDTIDNVNQTIGIVDQSLETLQTPLETIVNVAKTVDRANFFANRVVKDALDYISTNINTLLDWIKGLIAKIKSGKASANDVTSEEMEVVENEPEEQ